MVDEHRRDQPIDNGKFLDDSYQEQEYHEETKRLADKQPLVSNCHNAPVSYFSLKYVTFSICTECKNYCLEV